MMGVAGSLNDKGDITTPVYSYWPNDYGLYNMAGNVSEWVLDVYRPLSPEDVSDFRPYRGNVFKTKVLDEELAIAEKDSLGRIRWEEVSVKSTEGRRNYRKANNINYLDGDFTSSIYYNEKSENEKDEETIQTRKALMYDYGVTSMINDKARIYKGASWKDGAYWLSPGTKRFLDEDQATEYIGFRCAMTRTGSPVGNY
jgi:formylglycine-generating enzyme required for sulfatase activity